MKLKNSYGKTTTDYPRLDLGQTVITRGIKAMLDAGEITNNQLMEIFYLQSVHRWGTVNPQDNKHDYLMNLESLEEGNEGRVMGVHKLDKNGRDFNMVKVWIITEWDRSATTILLPSEY